MIYLKLFENFKDIDALCKEYDIENYTINSDGSIDVDGDVHLNAKKLDKLPLKFNRVSGFFYCYHNKLTSLEGSPKWVGGGFDCGNNRLISLKGVPKEVGGYFDCSHNQLTSLEGSPMGGGYFNCSSNNLLTLEGAPKEVFNEFYCHKNPLPKLIYDNYQYIEEIIKWQDEYNIWRKDDTLDEFRFEEMLIDIKEELNNDLLKTI